jgi:hypothetical protein
MSARRFLPHLAATLVFACTLAQAHEADSDKGRLGEVHFPTSCDPAVAAEFDRGVAMLHSFWYSAAEATFRDVLAKDPNCAIATWASRRS